jgi:hypothetical protein
MVKNSELLMAGTVQGKAKIQYNSLVSIKSAGQELGATD